MSRPRGSYKRTWPLIRFRPSTPFRPWVVDCGLIEGKRIRFSFGTKEEAEGKAAICRARRRNEGNGVFSLERFDRTDVETALGVLKPHGLTLTEAARFLVNNEAIIREPHSVASVVTELLRVKEQDGRSAVYLKELRTRLATAFIEEFGTRPIHEITPADLEDWLRERASDWSPVTRNNVARILGVLFNFARRRGYLLKDPTDQLERVKVQLKKPGILSVAEARGLLGAARADFQVVIALGLFAGLRPEAELWHLDWSQIDLEERLIDVATSKSSASHRFVKISDNLAAWLERSKRDSGPVCRKGNYFYLRLKNIRQKAAENLRAAGLPCPSLDDWPPDAMRHTFASMHYAHFKHAAETAEQMGHAGGLRIFFRHYRNRVKPAEAVAFWRLVPKKLVGQLPVN